MRPRIFVMLCGVLGWVQTLAQQNPADTVVIKVGESSKVIFAIHKDDIQTLKYYDFQALMDDMIVKLEKQDATAVNTPPSEYLKDEDADVVVAEESKPTYEWPKDEEDDRDYGSDRYRDEGEWVTYEGSDRDGRE